GLAVAMSLAMLVAGCAAILSGTPAIRAPQSVAAHPNTEVVGAAALGNRGPRADAGRTQAMLGKLPLYFVQNHGQEDARVAYYVQGHDTAVYFGPDGVTFALSRSTSGAPQDAAGAPTVQDAATAQTVS